MEEVIVKLLFEGKTQKEISNILKNRGLEPSGLSSIEKKLKEIKERHGAKTMFHLGAILAVKKYIRN